MTTMAAESVLEVVKRLQSRLAGDPEPKKLLKYLKRLSDLPVTVDILAETRVGKTVNGLRKHEHVGGLARDLVVRWKKLVLGALELERQIEPEEQDLERSSSRKRPREGSRKEESQESWKASCSQPHSPEYREKKRRKLSEVDGMLKASPRDETREERKRWTKISAVHTSDRELSDSPQPSTRPLYLAMDYDEEKEPVPQGKAGKSHGHAFQDRELNSQGRGLGEAQDRGSVSRSKEHKTSKKEKHRLHTREEKTLSLGRDKVSKAVSPEEDRRSPSGTGTTKKKQTLCSAANKESGSSKKFLPPLEVASVNQMPKTKPKDAQKLEKAKLSGDSFHVGKWEGEFSSKPKDKGGSHSLKMPEGKSKASDSDRKASSHFSGAGETDVEEDFEEPTMSFESYLTYDQPQSKKRKIAKTTTGVRAEKSHRKENGSKAAHQNPNNAVQNLPKMNGSKAEKQHSGTSSANPTLPDIPLPAIQADHCSLPSLVPIPSFQPKRKAVSAPQEEEEAGFIRRRMNSKMQVYSGSKCTTLPKMLSLSEQCIRVLSNNIDSIYEVGSVPYSVLEPVLEKCTPEQLYRIEQCNPVFTEDTDRLWEIHCHRDFARETPEELESWREMYLRLQDAREQRLRHLTENIRSAHANKPKGRQAKMAFVHSVAKPPPEVKRRQEKFGTGGAVQISAEEGPSTGSGPSAPAARSAVAYAPQKPPGKKIAPLMAKTIKAFKNRYYRR